LLAEFKAPVRGVVLAALLKMTPKELYRRMSILSSIGFVRESQYGDERRFTLDRAHPIIPALVSWLKYVNRRADLPYVRLASTLREQRQRHNATEWAWKQRHSSGVKPRLRRRPSLEQRLGSALSTAGS
jgi:hypothetical protein